MYDSTRHFDPARTENTFTRLQTEQRWLVLSPDAGIPASTVLVKRSGKSPRGVVLGATYQGAGLPRRAQGQTAYEIVSRLNSHETAELIESHNGAEPAPETRCTACDRAGFVDPAGLCAPCAERAPFTPEPAPEPARTGDTAAANLAQIIADIAAGAATPVDEAQVRAIVADALADFEAPEARVVVDVMKARDLDPVRIDNAHECLPDILMNVACGNHVYLVGQPAAGKTHIAGQVADAVGRTLYTVGALLTKYEAIGYQTATGEYITTACREAFEHGGVLLWDEVDASTPAALVALNAMLANGEYTFPDRTVKRHPDFVVIAAGNTFGNGADRQFVGRLQLDAATLDRFAFIEMGYDRAVESGIARAEFEAHGGTEPAQLDDWLFKVQYARMQCNEHNLRHVVSPRASVMGARLIARGMPIDKVFTQIIAKGASPDMVAKLGS
jgi:cobaltochelatase CobS